MVERKWVKPVAGGVTVNSGELLSFLSKGYVKSTIHRVYEPVADQKGLERLGLIYFNLFNDNVKLIPAPSPKLLRLGLITDEDLANPPDVPTSAEYTRARIRKRSNPKEFLKTRDPQASFKMKGIEVKSYYD